MRIDEFAKSVSHVLHANQKRNDGVTPYTVHTDYVGDNVEKYMYQLVESSTVKELEIARAIGYLHDVLEDVKGMNVSELLEIGQQEFDEGSDDDKDWAWIVSKVDTLSRYSKEFPVVEYLENIKAVPIVTAVKLTDLEHNMSDLKPGNLRDKYELCKYFLEN